MSLLGLANELHNKALSEQYYLKAVAALHRTYCDPRARDNQYHQWEVFVVARLINLKRIEGRDYEVEFLAEIMDVMVAECPTERPYGKILQSHKYPFPTNFESKYVEHPANELLEWVLEHLPIMYPSGILYRKSELSKNDLNSSNMST